MINTGNTSPVDGQWMVQSNPQQQLLGESSGSCWRFGGQHNTRHGSQNGNTTDFELVFGFCFGFTP